MADFELQARYVPVPERPSVRLWGETALRKKRRSSALVGF